MVINKKNVLSVVISSLVVSISACNSQLSNPLNTTLAFPNLNDNKPDFDKDKLKETLNSIKAYSGFKTLSITGNKNIQGKTPGIWNFSNNVLYAKGFTDYQGYQVNATSNKTTWAIFVKRKNKGNFIIDLPEKLPLKRKFTYLNSSFNFDEIYVFFASGEVANFTASISEDNSKEKFFTNPLDNVKCCYANRDLGAPGLTAGREHLGQDLIANPYFSQTKF